MLEASISCTSNPRTMMSNGNSTNHQTARTFMAVALPILAWIIVVPIDMIVSVPWDRLAWSTMGERIESMTALIVAAAAVGAPSLTYALWRASRSGPDRSGTNCGRSVVSPGLLAMAVFMGLLSASLTWVAIQRAWSATYAVAAVRAAPTLAAERRVTALKTELDRLRDASTALGSPRPIEEIDALLKNGRALNPSTIRNLENERANRSTKDKLLPEIARKESELGAAVSDTTRHLSYSAKLARSWRPDLPAEWAEALWPMFEKTLLMALLVAIPVVVSMLCAPAPLPPPPADSRARGVPPGDWINRHVEASATLETSTRELHAAYVAQGGEAGADTFQRAFTAWRQSRGIKGRKLRGCHHYPVALK